MQIGPELLAFTDAQLIERDAAIEARVRAELAAELETERAKLAEVVGAVHRLHARNDEQGPDAYGLYGCLGCDDGENWPCSTVRAISTALAAGSSRDTTPEGQ